MVALQIKTSDENVIATEMDLKPLLDGGKCDFHHIINDFVQISCRGQGKDSI
jgi:hypothetical protein